MKVIKHKARFNELLARVEMQTDYVYDIMFHRDWEDIKAGHRTTATEEWINNEFIQIHIKIYVPDPSASDKVDDFYKRVIPVQCYMSGEDFYRHCTKIEDGH